MKTYFGRLDYWFETGTEGVEWILYEDGKNGYDGIVLPEDGDYLEIYNEDGSILWSGVVEQDFEVGYQPYPDNPELGQPCALGMWIHWTQKGFEPDVWARFFMPKNGNKLRAKLFENENL